MDNLVHDISHANIIEKLVEKGLSEVAARREVGLVTAAYARQLNGHLRLQRALRGTSTELTTHTTLDAEHFWSDFWETNRPLYLPGHLADWPAVKKWGFDVWRRDFRDLPVEVEVDRSVDRNHEGRFETMTAGAFLDGIDTSDDAAPRNDTYCIARNLNARRAEWLPLYDDLQPDERLFDRTRVAGATSFWLGPRGTRTPLHHDMTNIFFCQIVGRKKFQLVPSHTTELWPHMDGYYVAGDMASVPARVKVLEVTLNPGDALFIPACWFHRVEALDASISYSLLNFRRRNAFDMFKLRELAADPSIPVPTDS